MHPPRAKFEMLAGSDESIKSVSRFTYVREQVEKLRGLYPDDSSEGRLVNYVTAGDDGCDIERSDTTHISIMLLAHLDPESYDIVKREVLASLYGKFHKANLLDAILVAMAPYYFIAPDETDSIYVYSTTSGTWTLKSADATINCYLINTLRFFLKGHGVGIGVENELSSADPKRTSAIRVMLTSQALANELSGGNGKFAVQGGVVDLNTLTPCKSHVFDFAMSRTGIKISDFPSGGIAAWKAYKGTAVDYVCGLLGVHVGKSLLSLLSTCMSGYNPCKICLIFYGPRNSGKSTFVRILCKAFAKAASPVPMSLMTSRRSGQGAASPELFRLKSLMLAFFQEPEGREKINTGVYKEVSGNDEVIARDLYKSFVTFRASCIPVFVVNSLLALENNDAAAVGRSVGVHFKKTFLGEKQCEKIKSHNSADDCEVMDLHMDSKIESLAGPMLAAIMWEYRKYKTRGHRVRLYEGFNKENEAIRCQISKLLTFIKTRIQPCMNSRIRMDMLLDRVCQETLTEGRGMSSNSRITITDLEGMLKDQNYACDHCYVYDAELVRNRV